MGVRPAVLLLVARGCVGRQIVVQVGHPVTIDESLGNVHQVPEEAPDAAFDVWCAGVAVVELGEHVWLGCTHRLCPVRPVNSVCVQRKGLEVRVVCTLVTIMQVGHVQTSWSRIHNLVTFID